MEFSLKVQSVWPNIFEEKIWDLQTSSMLIWENEQIIDSGHNFRLLNYIE